MLARSQQQATKAKKQSYQEPLKDQGYFYHDTASTASSGKGTSSLRASKLRRARSQQSVTSNRSNSNKSIDERDDGKSNRRSKQQSSSERRQRGSSLPRLQQGGDQARTAPSTDDMSAIGDIQGKSLFRADRRQKRVAYTAFSDNPYDVLEIRVEQNPPTPRDGKDVVVKVSVSR